MPARLAQHLVGDEILARAVALNNGRHHLLGHVGVVGQQLLGVLGQAVAAVAERRIVVMHPDARVEADALDDGTRVEALDLGVGVELVEVAHPQCQIGVGEQLDRLRLLRAHVESRDILLDGSLLQQGRERMRAPGQERYVGDPLNGPVFVGELRVVDQFRDTHDDARRV